MRERVESLGAADLFVDSSALVTCALAQWLRRLHPEDAPALLASTHSPLAPSPAPPSTRNARPEASGGSSRVRQGLDEKHLAKEAEVAQAGPENDERKLGETEEQSRDVPASVRLLRFVARAASQVDVFLPIDLLGRQVRLALWPSHISTSTAPSSSKVAVDTDSLIILDTIVRELHDLGFQVVPVETVIEREPSIPVIVMHRTDTLSISRARHLVNQHGVASDHVCAVMRMAVGPAMAEARQGAEAFGALLGAVGDGSSGDQEAEGNESQDGLEDEGSAEQISQGAVATQWEPPTPPPGHPYVLFVNELNEQVLEYVRGMLLRGEQAAALQDHLDTLTRP